MGTNLNEKNESEAINQTQGEVNIYMKEDSSA